MPQAIIFDMDGVILDSERIICDAWKSSALECGHPIEHTGYLRAVGRNGRDAQAILIEELGADFPFERVGKSAHAKVTAQVGQNGWPLKPGITRLFEMLAAVRMPLAVATSTRVREAEARLVSAGVRQYFRSVSGGDEVAHGKPAPDIFLLAAQRLGVPPRDCIVIEDSMYGVHGAHAAGMRAVLIPDLKQPDAAERDSVFQIFSCADEACGFLFQLIGQRPQA